MSPLTTLIAAVRRPPPGRLAVLDRWPTAVLVALGLLPGWALGTLALHRPAVLVAVLLLLPPALWWQGRRVRLPREWEAPAKVDLPSAPAPVPEPRGPRLVHDGLIDMIELPGGSFRMGSDKARDPQAYGDESPQRWVRLSPFAMARTPVTRGLYRSLIDGGPSQWGQGTGDDALPANYVCWDDAVRFCNALSQRSARSPCYRHTAAGWDCDWTADGYRLPTEAEWEYACRAGTETPWFWGADAGQAGRHAWFSGNAGGRPHPVAGKDSNPWGLHDLAGNCWEWCWDWYAPYDPRAVDDPRGLASGDGWRVLRGGSFDCRPRLLRSADRARSTPEGRNEFIGFRCVRGAGRQPVA